MARQQLRGFNRGIRTKNPPQSNKIRLTLPKTRTGLFLGSALRGGSLTDFGAALAKPRPSWLSTSTALAVGMLGGVMVLPADDARAAASCAQSPTNTWTCTGTGSGATPEATIAPSANGFAVNVGNSGGTANTYTDTGNFNASNLGAIVINDSGGYSGTVTVRNTSTLKANKADGLRFYTTGTGGPDVTFNVNGTVYGGNDAAGSSGYTLSPGDGLHVGQASMHAPDNASDGSIANLTVNVGNVNNRDAVVRGADDGIEIAQNVTTQVTVTNYGTVNGLGRKGDNTGVADAENWGEGIHISTVDAGYGSGHQIDGAATVNNFGIVVGHQNTGSVGDGGAGSGVNVSAKGAIAISNTVIVPPGPVSANDGPGSIRGTDGVVAYGDGTHDITLTNNGHIQGDLGVGADLSHAKNIVAANHTLGSMIGATNGIVLHDAETANYDNSSGLTAGQTGNGVVIHDINGVTTGTPPQYNITVDNTKYSGGDSGGIIVGYGSGVSLYGNEYSVNYAAGTNGVLLDNSGAGTDSEGTAGGLIVGITGNGVEITGTYGDVKVDNSYTANGKQNNLAGTTAIDPLVGYSGNAEGPSLLDKTVSEGDGGLVYGLNTVLDQAGSPASVSGGITTGIWGYGWGVYQENIGGTATVDNRYGQIFGKAGDGIKLSSIGLSITSPVDKVVDIDNSHGLIEGGNDAVKLYDVQHGGASFNNNSGISLGAVNGVEIDPVQGSVTVQNQSGLLGGYAGFGASLTNIDGAASYDNEGGVTFGDSGNGVTISNIGGKGSEGDAVSVNNSNGGLIAGSNSGVEISHVTGDASEGDAVDILVNNSGADLGEGHYTPGGLIIGLGAAGVSIHDIGPSESDGEAGNVTIDNRYTGSSSYDLAGLGNGAIYSEGDPSTGLLGTFVDTHGETVAGGIYGTTGIYGSNIAGTITVLNEQGKISGETDAGISLSSIGGGVVGSVAKVVDIDNTSGSIAGQNDGVKLAGIQHGGASLKNNSGTTQGGANGVEMDGVGGTASVQNLSGRIAGLAGAGALLGSVDGAVSFENEGGATYGLSGNGMTISNVAGHAEGDNAVAVYNGAGGLITGSFGGVEINNVTADASEGDAADILVDNSGSDLGEGDYAPGGLIVGAGGAGVSIHDIGPIDSDGEAGTVTVDNRYTGHSTYDLVGLGNADIYSEGDPSTGLLGPFADLQGNRPTGGIYGTIGVSGLNIAGDVVVLNQEGLIVGSEGGVNLSEVGGDVDIHNERLSESGDGGRIAGSLYGVDVTSIDGALTVNNDYGSITANATSGTSYGVHGQNIGGTAGIQNSYGTISSAIGDGINLASIGGNLTSPVEHVVDIDNSNGTVTGGTDHNGASISTVLNGGVRYNNNGGATTGPAGGIDIDSVAGSVTVTNNSGGLIKGGTAAGLDVNDVDQVVSVDNEGGVTFSLATDKNGISISNVGGGESEGDAVAVHNGKGGIIAGANGVEISNVTGDGSEGDANDILVDNSAKYLGSGQFSAGGIIVATGGVGHAGVDIHDVGPTDSEGEAGTVTIDNRRTLHTSIDFGDVANNDIYSEGDPSTGLLGTFVDDHGDDGVVGSGIYGWFGVSGANIGGKVVVENQDGLIEGVLSGVKLDTVGGDVEIDNGRAWRHGDGGLITAHTYGLQLDNIAGNLTVDNDHGTITADREAGTIYGISGNHIAGTVGIDNTRGEISSLSTSSFGIHLVDTGAITLTNKGGTVASEGDGSTAVYVSEGDSLTIDNTRAWHHGDGGSILGGKYGVYAESTGTVDIDNQRGVIGTGASEGDEDGSAVFAENVTGNLKVKNARGVILDKADGGFGIYGSSISGLVDIDNGTWHADPGEIEDYGFIGGTVGISLAGVGNGIDIDNSRGVVLGQNQAIVIDQTEGEGDVHIRNSAGMIEGYRQKAIQITSHDNVYISNGDDHGGVIAGGVETEGGSAIDVTAFAVSITNGASWIDDQSEGDTVQGGLIVGAGNGPVISLNTSSSEDGGATITNKGIIAALGLNPYRYTDGNSEGDGGSDEFASNLGDVTLPYASGLPLSNDLLPSEEGLKPIYDDAADIKAFALNDGDGSIANLAGYADAAAHAVVETKTGAAWLYNKTGAIVFGTVNMTGRTANEDGDYGNAIWNTGTWFTRGLNTLSGAGENFITNGGGLIQTAFGDAGEETTFDVADFYNAYTESEGGPDGVLSSADGDTSDKTTITGNFYGAATLNDGGFGSGGSFIALDAYLDSSDGDPAADLVHIGGNAYGTTGLIINNLNTNGISTGNTDGIKVVEVAGTDAMRCLDVACQFGDTFYISSKSANYLEINGRGTIQSGMFAWYLTEEDNNPDPDYVLKTAALPTADQAPELVTAFADIFYDGGDVVSEHLNGGQYSNNGDGGGGADPSDARERSSAIWGKASGSWTNRDTTVESTAFGTVDTGLNQNTYTLLGGVDMSPSADGEGIRMGVFGGYAESRLTFDAYAANAKYKGGVAGGYVAYAKDELYANAQFNANMMDMTFNAPFGGGVSGTSDGTTLGVIANVGKRFYAGSTFVEPTASFTYADTTIGDLTSGTARVSFSDGQSIRAGAGARVGTRIGDASGGFVEVSLLGRVWDEFAGNNTVTVTDGGNTDTFTDNVSGVFGEMSGSIDAFSPDRKFSTYVSGGAQFKPDSLTWNAKVGVRQGF